tara:strand:+ start:2745 stop:3017 length:273 start_codon:yes stop_codon:yes gene_type:complete
MLQRTVTIKDLETLAAIINDITNSPKITYDNGRFNVGNFNISQAYGGVCLHRIISTGGGVTCPIENCHVPKRELWDKMQAFRNGLEWSTK